MHRSDLVALVVGMSVGVSVGMGGGALGTLLALRARSSELPHMVRQQGGLNGAPPGSPAATTADMRKETLTSSSWIVVKDGELRPYLVHSGRR